MAIGHFHFRLFALPALVARGFRLCRFGIFFQCRLQLPALGYDLLINQQVGMQIGIRTYRDPKRVSRLPGMLALPFIGKVAGYAINQRT